MNMVLGDTRDAYSNQTEWCRRQRILIPFRFDFIWGGYNVRVLLRMLFVFFFLVMSFVSQTPHDLHAQLCFHSRFVFTAHFSLDR